MSNRTIHEGVSAEWRQRVIDMIVRRCRELDGVLEAHMSPDGTRFMLWGPDWTEALSEAGADLAVRIQESLAPDGQPYIEGGFLDGRCRFDGWECVYPDTDARVRETREAKAIINGSRALRGAKLQTRLDRVIELIINDSRHYNEAQREEARDRLIDQYGGW